MCYEVEVGCLEVKIFMATPNKFSVSRPGLRNICMRAGGPFPLFHYKIG